MTTLDQKRLFHRQTNGTFLEHAYWVGSFQKQKYKQCHLLNNVIECEVIISKMAIKIVSTATYISCQPEQDEVEAVSLFLKEVLLKNKESWFQMHW